MESKREMTPDRALSLFGDLPSVFIGRLPVKKSSTTNAGRVARASFPPEQFPFFMGQLLYLFQVA